MPKDVIHHKDYSTEQEKPEKVEKKVNEEEVSIPKSSLQELLDRVKRLEYAASKAAIGKFDEKRKKSFGKEATVRTFDDKIIVGWKLTKDIVEKNPMTGLWFEDQRIQLAFLGEEELSEEIPYQTFVRRYKNLPVKVVKEHKDPDTDSVSWTVETLEGETKTFDIHIQFVN